MCITIDLQLLLQIVVDDGLLYPECIVFENFDFLFSLLLSFIFI